MDQGTKGITDGYLHIPDIEDGMTVGLFGGSFNPPHEAHRLVAQHALKVLQLDQLWWMVTPGNPLKDHSELAPLAERIRLSEALTVDPKVKVTAFEASHTIRFSADTVKLLREERPQARFVWIMGADSLKNFHEWERWQYIVESMPIAVFDRPGSTFSYRSSVMAKTYSGARLDEADAARLAQMQPPAWAFIHGPRSTLSSTAIRHAAERSDKS